MAAELKIPRLLISAAASGSGKTTFTMGLMAALCRRGLQVQPFKVGPDYIDPAFHGEITGRPSINLDGWMVRPEDLQAIFQSYASQAEIAVIEGVMGLYDGRGGDPLEGSTAGMAKTLQAPVILVLQAGGMAASAAAIVFGMKEFRQVDIAGVVINKPSSPNHYQTVKQAIENLTGVPVLGFLPNAAGIQLQSRHLGLVQSSETEDLPRIISALADLVSENVDIDQLLRIASAAVPLEKTAAADIQPEGRVRIAVADDKAFRFYYHENLQVLRRLGAEIVFFSPLEDKALPSGCHGVYLGGGYPEVFAPELHSNFSLRQSLRDSLEGGMPCYAECGGYMFLNKKFIDQEGQEFDFVGFFGGEVTLTERLQNFGYTEITALTDTVLLPAGGIARGHEFHKSLIHRPDEDYCVQAEKIRDGQKTTWHCGARRKEVFGMYPHIYFPSYPELARNFVRACLEYGRVHTQHEEE